jgi:uncharacterized membrane protein
MAKDAATDKARAKAKAQGEKRKLELMNAIEQNNLSSSDNSVKFATPATAATESSVTSDNSGGGGQTEKRSGGGENVSNSIKNLFKVINI